MITKKLAKNKIEIDRKILRNRVLLPKNRLTLKDRVFALRNKAFTLGKRLKESKNGI